MKIPILMALACLLCACETVPPNHVAKSGRTKARITAYRTGEDKYGSHIAMSKYQRAKEGVTVAAESAMPFHTKIQIPKLAGIIGRGTFEVQDRGSAVEARKASRGQLPVIDVYVASMRKFRWCKAHLPEVMDIIYECP